MRPGNNPIETYKASKGGDGLRIREDLPRFIHLGYESLTPADKELLKWVGVFFRKPTPGKFMMRIRMPNGFATSEQLVAIADLSERLGNGTLDITTRQQIELRGYTLAGVPEIWEQLRGVNLRSLQTGMDNIRNLNGCPLAGVTPDELLDASPIVRELDQLIVGDGGNPEFTNLPRKMNVTVTGCLENCTHNESQDIALVPATRALEGTTTLGFHVLVGGKMGSGGFTIASNLGWFIEPRQAVDVVIAIITLFRDEGPRDSRTKCRLAFLLEEWGADRFRTALAARLGWNPLPAGHDARVSHHTDHLGMAIQRQPNLYSVGLSVTVGRIRHESLRELARLARVYGTGEVRLTTGQNAILTNIPQTRLDALLREPLLKELPPEPSRFVRGLVSCTGIQYCNLAVIETKARAVAIAHALEQRLGPDGEPLTVHWSGCPAACGNHLAADIGLRGMKVNVGGRSVDAVAVYVGGRTGPNARVAQPIMEMVPCDDALPDVLATVIKHLELFKQVEPHPGIKDRVLMVPACAPAASLCEAKRAGAGRPAAGDDEAGDNGHRARRVAGITPPGAVPSARSESRDEDIADDARSHSSITATTGEAETTPPLAGGAKGARSLRDRSSVANPSGGGAMTSPRTVKVKACDMKELAEGSGRLVTVGGKAVALFRVGERVVALDAECPHEGGPLQDGTIEGGCVVCPWHNYKFELASGQCDGDPRLKVNTYPTAIEEETVVVEVRA